MIDLSGKRFGKWVIVPNSRFIRGRNCAYWLGNCDCGVKLKPIFQGSLIHGKSKSCGCNRTTHGHSRRKIRPTYLTWMAMLKRCRDKKNKIYGGRGIAVCKRWFSFENFLQDMGERPDGKTIDRYPNKDGDYEPSNCRWATPEEQYLNRRSTKCFTYNGKTLSMNGWARESGIHKSVMFRRLAKYGWTIEMAVTTPVRR